MLSIRAYEDADRAAWDAYVRAAPGSHPGQLIAWKTVTGATYGCPARYTLAEDDGRVRGVLPLFAKQRTLFSAPGGLLADDETVARALLASVGARVAAGELASVELRDQQRRWPELPTSEEHCTFVLSLAADADAQWRAFDAKLRNQVRKGERGGFTIHRGVDGLTDFHRIYVEAMRDLGTPVRGLAYFRRLVDALDGAAEVFVLARGAEPVGAMFLVVHGECAFDFWAASLRRHLADCPNQVLYWAALRFALERGLRRFDFGRSQWHSGTYRFKEQWGAAPVPLYYQYLLAPGAHLPSLADQKRTYELAVRVWKRLPLPVARVLGERVKRRFPEVM